ncbi:uncharacterized protein BDW43DRAFT_295917 [Aspergillus alliaceus]|uniref:uncharacterized protein n=1 Tax=Petromyces alliaceus TaxID=209559 RepID=UPI0012A3B95C|nr:uncharacterized protein BDW43DRAFT_295917 [Aspergillus alliaceus]KAB8239501.1 hypothetical protein BDW43DRAFT_295917 [Aspergillus alliaceus]
MASITIHLSCTDYTVGWVCALPIEMAAAKAMLGEVDYNIYTLGRIATHDIIIVCLASGVYGGISAEIVTSQIQAVDLRLGQVVISKPTRSFGGAIQYDYGKETKEWHLERTGTLSKPPQSLLVGPNKLEADHLLNESSVSECLAPVTAVTLFIYPGAQEDLLFQAGYDHPSAGLACRYCEKGNNQVVKNGLIRDRPARELGVLCFEMEAAGSMDQIPCLATRRGYATAMAATCAKEILSVVPHVQIDGTEGDKAIQLNEGSNQSLSPSETLLSPELVHRDLLDSSLTRAAQWDSYQCTRILSSMTSHPIIKYSPIELETNHYKALS